MFIYEDIQADLIIFNDIQIMVTVAFILVAEDDLLWCHYVEVPKLHHIGQRT